MDRSEGKPRSVNRQPTEQRSFRAPMYMKSKGGNEAAWINLQLNRPGIPDANA